MNQFLLEVISQERQLLSEAVDSITLPTVSGELTILPNHVPLFTKVTQGVMVYRRDGQEHFLVVSTGFLDVTGKNHVAVLVDSAVLAREVSVQKAEAAIRAAHETMSKTVNQREMMMAEASLRQAMLELKLAQRTKKHHDLLVRT